MVVFGGGQVPGGKCLGSRATKARFVLVSLMDRLLSCRPEVERLYGVFSAAVGCRWRWSAAGRGPGVLTAGSRVGGPLDGRVDDHATTNTTPGFSWREAWGTAE